MTSMLLMVRLSWLFKRLSGKLSKHFGADTEIFFSSAFVQRFNRNSPPRGVMLVDVEGHVTTGKGADGGADVDGLHV